MTRAVAIAVVALAACGDDANYLTTEELMQPEACQMCHPKHFDEWSGSMHAYASDDPVFLAMNRKGQADTGGALGDFCVNCHAPLAVRLGLTTDGLDLADVPQWAKGVTCFFCHSVDRVDGDHNNPLILAGDDVIRGGIRDPIDSPAHRNEYSTLLDSEHRDSSATCGACHDIVTQAGVHLERTFVEWQASIFGQDAPSHLTCGQCHMFAQTDVVADVPGLDVPLRPFGRREHTFAGIDVALTPWPFMAEQRAAIARDLDPAVLPRLCVRPEGMITLRLDSIGVGHMWPSGAAQDRRAWAEVIAYDGGGGILFQSGVVPDGVDPESIGDPNLFRMWDDTFDAGGQPTHMFWEVASYTSTLLEPAVTVDIGDPRFDHSTTRPYPISPAMIPQIARITSRVLIRPLPFALLDELEPPPGNLDPAVRGQVITIELAGSILEWTPDSADIDGCVD